STTWRAPGQDYVRLQRKKLVCKRLHPLCVVPRSAIVDPQIATFAPAQLLQGLLEDGDAGLTFRIVRGRVHQHANTATSSGCCARATNGHAKAAPPRTLTNSRRLIASPEGLRGQHTNLK